MDSGVEGINLDRTLPWLRVLGFILYANGEQSFIKMGDDIIMLF